MAPSILTEEVAEYMGSIVSDQKLLAECESICTIYNITPESLKYKWEALNYNTGVGFRSSEPAPFTMDTVVTLKAQAKRDLEKAAKNAKKTQRKAAPTTTASVNRSRMPRFMSRTGAFPIKVEGKTGMDLSSMAGPSKVKFAGPKMDASSRKERAYRYMYEKISERSEVLDDRIDQIGKIVMDHYGVSEFGDPSSSTDEDTVIVGRIVHDFEIGSLGGRLTDATISIEASRLHASGARVRLQFDSNLKIRGGAHGAAALGLFPGAIVALKGKNGGGGWYQVSEILALPPLPHPASAPDAPQEEVEDGQPFSMCIASGPFTPNEDLDFKPWRSLLRILRASTPAVILLVGPFVDASHPLVRDGDVDVTHLALFKAKFIGPLRAILDSSPGSIALLVPSVRDIVSAHAVFPQCEFEPELTMSDPRIRLLPNPCRFSLNAVTFAVTSVDVVFHLKKEELVKRGQDVESLPQSPEDSGTDPMGNLCRHVLQQRSFYPIFPVPEDLSHEINLDVTHSDALDLEDDAPDVLILPSRLKHFSKCIHSTTAINPSFLNKLNYAMLEVDPSAAAGSSSRCRVDILKLDVPTS